MAELVVDEKNRVMLPRELRRRLGITSGSKLEAEQRGAEIIMRPVVAVKKPTQALWGLAQGVPGRNTKREAREAIASRRRLGR